MAKTETYQATYTSREDVQMTIPVDLPYTVEDLLRDHGKWDIRPPHKDDKRWSVWPMYHPVSCGADSESLVSALQLSLVRGLLVEEQRLWFDELRSVRIVGVDAE